MSEAAERMSNYEMILRYLQLPSSILPLAVAALCIHI
jgi:hypothetical protein